MFISNKWFEFIPYVYLFILDNYSNKCDFIVSKIIDRFKVCLKTKSHYLWVNKPFVKKTNYNDPPNNVLTKSHN
jgi:hypothetical protein